MRSLGLVAALLALFSVGTQAQVTYAGAWTQQQPGTAPPARYAAAMASDAAGNVVLFSGSAGLGSPTPLNDTWVWNGSTWTQKSPANSPPARVGASMAYDAAHGVVVLFGGEVSGNAVNDTWTWDGANWTQQEINADPAAIPSPRYFAAMAYDVAGHVVLFGGALKNTLLGGDTWVWNGSSWSQPTLAGNTPAPRYSAAMAYDAASGQTVLFGGTGESQSVPSETWTWDGSTWTQQSPSNSPPGRYYANMAYDAANGGLVLFGGDTGGELVNDTWTWNGSAWTLQSPPASPPITYEPGMAYASSAQQMVLFGGLNLQSDTLDDTWTYQLGPYNFGNVNVCTIGQTTPAPCSPLTTLTFQIGSNVTIGSVKVVTQGAANLDFTQVSNTCVGSQTATCTVRVAFAPLAPGVRTGAVEIFDGGGNLLASEPLSGIGQAPAVVFPSAATQTVIADLSPNQPRNLTVDAAGNVFVAECCQNGPDQVLEIKGDSSGTTTITTQVPDGGGGLFGVAEDGAGDLYAASPNTDYIYQIPTGCQLISCYLKAGFAGEANQIALDAAGDLFAVDGLGRVYKYPPTCIGSSNLANCGIILGSGFKDPQGVAVDAAGNVYVADNGNGVSRVVKIPADGSAQSNVGVGLIAPVAVAVDAAGDVFIADESLAYIVEVPALCTKAECQLQIGSGFSVPIGVAVDAVGNVYVSDQSTGKVSKIALATPPALTFPTTNVGSSSSAQSFLLQNVGNQALTGSLAVGTGFAQAAGTGAPADCAASLLVAPGTACNASIDFSPTAANLYSSAAVFTDNALNATPSAAVQSVALSGTGVAATVNVAIGASPAGLGFSINGTNYTSTQTPTLTVGTAYTLATTSPQYAGGTQFSFAGWSDGTATITDTLTPTAATTSDTANFSATAYQLTVTAGAGGSVTVGTAANGYYPVNSAQPLVATPNTGYYFTGWTGSSDIAAASSATTYVTMTAAEIITAHFAAIPRYAVTNVNDSGPGSLRAAITAADSTGAGSIIFDPALASQSSPATITLLSALPEVNGIITITGPGANALTVSGNNSATVGSIFVVSGGATVSLSGLTLAQGFGSGYNGAGAIGNSGTLTIANCILSGNANSTGYGGAINSPGSLTVTNSTFSGNTALYEGAAIHASALVVTGSTFYNNVTNGAGGAIFATSSATVSNSTFVNNVGYAEGGAIYGGGTVTNSVFSGNQAGYGAAIFGAGSTLNANDNLYDNNVDLQNANALSDICEQCTSNTNPVSGSANLAPLGNYGGPTTTMLPLPGSAAICAGSAALVPVGDMFDQRGFPISTTYGSTVCSDLGAVQTSYGLSFTTEPPATGTVPGTAMSAVAVTVKESGNLLSGGSASVKVTDANADLTTTPATGATTAGVATFNSLIFTSSTTSDTLTATLPLNPALTTPLSITTPSTSFSVSPSTVNVSIGTSPAGLSFSINGTASTSTQTPTLTIGTAYTLATTSPQYAQGTQFSFVSWSDGATTTTDTLTPTATTTSDTASFSATGYQLTVTAGAGGTITGTAANGYYTAASQQSLVATPNAGYYFTGWTGSSDIASASSASTSVTMNAPETITAGFAQIPGYTVTNLNDAGSGSLRAAITSADANNGGAGTITFTPSLTGTITLLSALPVLNGAITISGPGATAVTVSGNSSTTVGSLFAVSSGATVTISGLTLANGSVASNGNGFAGGAIQNSGTLTVSNCILSGNADANGTGGAIYSNGKLTVANSILANNVARGYKNGGNGGAIDSVAGTVTVTDSTFSGNITGTQGGAIFAETMVVTGSTFYNNFTNGSGGALAANGSATVSNSTFVDNVGVEGGAIYSFGGTVTNSIFSANQATYGAAIDNTQFLTANYNLYDNNGANGQQDDCFACLSNTNPVSGAANLAPLGNYGGPTTTMLPLPGSAAICAGSAALVPAGDKFDQRGFPISTTYGSTVCSDLGAVQTNYGLSFTTEPPATGTAPGTAMSAVAVTVKESGNLLTGGAASVNVSDANTDLTTTPATGSTAAGVATFSSLIFTSSTTGDTLTATLPLNAALTTPLSVSALSTSFSVSPSTVKVSIGTNPAGLSFSINGTANTSTQTPTLTIGTAYTLATTSPQYAQGTQFSFVGWSDGATTTTDTLTPTVTTTSDTASFSATGYQLTVTAGAGGTITGTAANGYYTAASQQSLVATPNAGYYFTGWTGSPDVASASSASTTVTMNAPESITAGFASIPRYTVTNLSDSSNSGSLRAAITAADANNGGAGTITFAPSLTGTITLLSALPSLNGAITISGPGASVVTVSGNNAANVGAIFVVNSGATVGISGLTIANGAGAGYGGGIDNKGTLALSNCAVTGNKAGASGPGGIYNDNDAKLTVIGSTFSGNTGYLGGGIGSIGVVLVSNSTFNQNVALRGGGISNLGTLTANDSTFSGNQAASGGGGIDNTDPNVKLNNNILSGNTAGNSLAADCDGCGVQSSGNLLGGAPLLAPLGNYGGPTQTMLPLPGSPAICAGSAALIPAGTTTDQRGFPISTTYGSIVCTDLGAVQTSYGLSFTKEPPATGTVPGTAMSAVAVTVKESGNLLTGGAATVNVSDANTDLTTTPATGATAGGVATFSSLIFKAATTGDTLSATLPLNLNIPLSISTQSTAFSVAPVTPALSFVPLPKTQTYGTAIAAGSLDATATASNVTVPGTFAYTTTINGVPKQPVTAGVTLLPAGAYTITASFTPANPSADTAGSTTAAYSVTQATPTLTLPTASAIVYGQTLAASMLTGGSAHAGSATVAGTFTFTTPTTAPTPGAPLEGVTFTPSNTTDYATVTASVSVVVAKATPAITWTTPAPITYGTALSATQLDAKAGSVAGIFSYTPASGILAAGIDKLSVTFTPTLAADYNVASASVMLTVNKASPTMTVTSSMNPSGYGQPVTLTATLHASATGETGTVSWIPALCAPTTVSAGIAQCTVSTLALGTHTIGASYSGDKNFNGTQGALPGTQLVEDALKLSASSIVFNNVYRDLTVTQMLTLTNTGPTAVTISSVSIPVPKVSGTDAQEFIAHSLCPSSLASGKSCTINITFNAYVEDYSPSASLIITDSAVGSPQTIPLSATVINPRLEANPTTLSFPTQKAGTTSIGKRVTLLNCGTTPLDFTALSISGNFAFATGTSCSTTTPLAPGATCTLNVVFKPTSTGLKSGSITITDNAYVPGQVITLSGTGN